MSNGVSVMTDCELAALPPLLDALTAARLLGVSRVGLYRMVERGDVPARKVGGRWRFSRDALFSLLGVAVPGSQMLGGGE